MPCLRCLALSVECPLPLLSPSLFSSHTSQRYYYSLYSRVERERDREFERAARERERERERESRNYRYRHLVPCTGTAVAQKHDDRSVT